MDLYRYPTRWSETDLKRPSPRLECKAWRYVLELGEVPGILAQHTNVYQGNPFDLKAQPQVNINLTGDPRGSVDGHHTVVDGNFSALLETDPDVPAAPCFVRDLAGRMIYVGGPLIKSFDEWKDYPAFRQNEDGSVENSVIPFITFPQYARHADDMQGHDLLEHVLLVRFRMLDMSIRGKGTPSGYEEDDESELESPRLAGSYDGANLYPYKYRLDTFYIDGYKLPQTLMLYAKRGQGIHPTEAAKLGEELLNAWHTRQPGQSYEEFAAARGDDWAEGLFEKGCTLIPTFEAANGYHVVGETFELEDFWPGRSVPGLHDVVERRADKAPDGTILEVLQPGYITGSVVVPAVVVTSDGSGYVSPNVRDPLPFVPNMTLAHQRTLADWYATWLPTHPRHFEAPALWGFDIITGHFMQLAGPLWDPLHYYYNCMDPIIMAMKKPLEQEQNRWLVPVPQEFHNRFHPIVPMHGFDVHSAEALLRREEENRRPMSIVTRVRNGKESAGIGYHPLPIEFEYELDPFWFPTLHPLNREQGEIPADLEERIAPVIRPQVSVGEYLEHVNGPEHARWLRDEDRMMRPSENPLENYPQLLRFVAPNLPLVNLLPLIPVPFLADAGLDFLGVRTEEYFAGEDDVDALAQISPNIFDAWWDARTQGHQWVKFRHMLYQSALDLYGLAVWYGATPLLLEDMLADWMESMEAAEDRAEAAVRQMQG